MVSPLPINTPGLSPLARGTLFAADGITLRYRFIPAGAGNTLAWSHRRQSSPVYPRWRGEHFSPICNPILISGLSPLARGTLDRHFSNGWLVRFIPAGAGNTPSPPENSCGWAVYPRWRGEHFIADCLNRGISGLSPLARGTHGRAPAATGADRFIPAGAGNTPKPST